MALPRGLRNNNPGNIRINSENFVGEIKPSQDSAFKQFESMAYGYRAIFKILDTYSKKYGLNTIEKIIGRWAPSNENNTAAYIAYVSNATGILPTTTIDVSDDDSVIKIVAAISAMENGLAPDYEDIRSGLALKKNITVVEKVTYVVENLPQIIVQESKRDYFKVVLLVLMVIILFAIYRLTIWKK